MRTLSLLFLLGCKTNSESHPDSLQDRVALLESNFAVLQEENQNILEQNSALTATSFFVCSFMFSKDIL